MDILAFSEIDTLYDFERKNWSQYIPSYIEFNLYEFDFDYDLYEDGFYILR